MKPFSFKVSGGELRGRRLAGPRRGSEMRPTTERVREAVFWIASATGRRGPVCLTSFCGTGALGTGGALARGGERQSGRLRYFTGARPAQRTNGWNWSDRAEVVRSDALRWLSIFCRLRARSTSISYSDDPPYRLVRQPLPATAGPATCAARWRKGGPRVVETFSPRRRSSWGCRWGPGRERAYGDTLVAGLHEEQSDERTRKAPHRDLPGQL